MAKSSGGGLLVLGVVALLCSGALCGKTGSPTVDAPAATYQAPPYTPPADSPKVELAPAPTPSSNVDSTPAAKSEAPASQTFTPDPPAPADDHNGATAECRDGSLSYSANHRGTCSHHGGVAVWYR